MTEEFTKLCVKVDALNGAGELHCFFVQIASLGRSAYGGAQGSIRMSTSTGLRFGVCVEALQVAPAKDPNTNASLLCRFAGLKGLKGFNGSKGLCLSEKFCVRRWREGGRGGTSKDAPGKRSWQRGSPRGRGPRKRAFTAFISLVLSNFIRIG